MVRAASASCAALLTHYFVRFYFPFWAAGLSDAYDNSLMGMCAELIASEMNLTREQQVRHSLRPSPNLQRMRLNPQILPGRFCHFLVHSLSAGPEERVL